MTNIEERDLKFVPVHNPQPKSLTPEQIEFYNTNGYIRPLRIFDELEASVNRTYFDWILARVMAERDDRNPYSINGYQKGLQGLYDLCRHPKILDLVEDLIGPNIICWGTHFFCKMPHDEYAVPWHQDASYWPFSPTRTVTVWLAIDDADAENAAMQFLPGTHRMGHLKWKPAQGAVVLSQEIENAETLGAPVFDELKAGELSLHADMLAHGSEPNLSDRRRCGLTIRYCPIEVRAINNSGWNSQSFIARGSDPSGHWANIPRPIGEDITPPVFEIHAG